MTGRIEECFHGSLFLYFPDWSCAIWIRPSPAIKLHSIKPRLGRRKPANISDVLNTRSNSFLAPTKKSLIFLVVFTFCYVYGCIFKYEYQFLFPRDCARIVAVCRGKCCNSLIRQSHSNQQVEHVYINLKLCLLYITLIAQGFITC